MDSIITLREFKVFYELAAKRSFKNKEKPLFGMQKKRFHSVLLALVCCMLFFLDKIDKMAIFGLHILKILHENNFWTKKRLFFDGSLND